MKKLKNILISLCILGFAACDNTLDYDESATYDEKDIFTSFDKTQQFVTNIYSFLENLTTYGGALLSSATDESVFPEATLSYIHYFYNGGWGPTRPILSWANDYTGIRRVNRFLKESEGQTFPQFAANKDYPEQMERFENYKWEVRFLRAFFYFDIVRNWGDAPFVGDLVLTDAQANSLKRVPAAELFDYIVSECEVAAAHLPVTYQGTTYAEVGRITRGAALALRARAALYAASPLFNPDGDKALWLRAALANYDVLKYAEENGIRLGAYNALWGSSSFNNAEYLLVRSVGTINAFESDNFPVGVEGGKGGNAPTQNLVDAYQMKATGKFWNEEGSGYDETNPWEGRDPRLAMTVAVNGETGWPNYNTNPLETWYGGTNAEPLTGATSTGYYLKKLLDASVDLRPNTSTSKLHTWGIFRLGEFYLNYAEAVFRYFGNADVLNGDLPLSATAAVNKIRTRAGVDMPELEEGMDDAAFWKYYEAERMVELAFENHRYYDVRRWKLGAERFKNIYLMKITKNADGSFTYTRQTKVRNWDDKMNLCPVSYSERMKNPNLTQNPGW